MKRKRGRPRNPPELARTKHLGLRLTKVEAVLLGAFVHLEQHANPLARVTMSSLVKNLAIDEARRRGFEVFRRDDGKIGLKKNGEVIPIPGGK